MGRHKFGGGAIRCEVCADKITHQNSEVVGRKASGTARCVHKRARCWRKWTENQDAIRATWAERRPTADTTGAASTAPPFRQEVVAVPTPKPPTVPTSAPKPTQKQARRSFYRPKPALVTLLLQLLQKQAYYKGWAMYYYRFIEGQQADILRDAMTGEMPTQHHFWTLVKSTNERLGMLVEAQRAMGLGSTPVVTEVSSPPVPAPAPPPPLKLVPAENPKELRAKLDEAERQAVRSTTALIHVASVLQHVGRLAAAGEVDTLAAVADMLERP